MTHFTMFSTPVFVEDVKDTNLEKEALIKLAYKMKSREPSQEKTNVGGYQTGAMHKSTEFLNLIAKLQQNINENLNTYAFDQKLEIKVRNAWININNKDAFNRPHVHPSSEFACIFYLKIPENSGNVVFIKDSMYRMDGICDLPAKESNILNCLSFFIKPEENRFVMFPSYVEHFVEENKSTEDRISLSFNLSVTPKQ